MKVRLTRRQHDLLICDSGADNSPKDRDYYGETIGNELRAGNMLSVTTESLSMVIDLADHDADTNDQRVFKNLLRKMTALHNQALEQTTNPA